MKKMLLTFLLMYCAAILKSPVRDTTRPIIPLQLNPDLLFQKARKQKTTAWILLGAGAGLTLAGGIIGTNAINDDPGDPFTLFSSGVQIGGALILAGAASMVASAPFFIASGKNKRKASLLIKNETSIFRQLHSKGNSISVGISLNL